MTLTTRLSLFFLTALALVLLGFSTTLFLLARTYLYRQVDERLEATLDTLAATAEVEAGEVTWEAGDRRPTIGQDAGADQVRWLVQDGRGRTVGRSPNLEKGSPLEDSIPGVTDEKPPAFLVYREGRPWRLLQRRLHAERPTPRADSRVEEQQPAKSKKSLADSPPTKGRKSRAKNTLLTLTSGVSLEPVEATLGNLGGALAGLSLGVWLLAAFLGHWLCRRALLPVKRMAQTARSMSAASLDQRLPVNGARDELSDLGRAFNDLLARLQESFERQRRFTGDASHQLRTPLTAMLGQIEVALRRHRSPDEYHRVLTLVNGQAVHLRQIVETLLFLARADAEARMPQLETLSLSAWLPEHLHLWSGHARAADLRLESLTDDPLGVKVQAPLLGQLVDNLLDNACKYSEPGTPITLRLQRGPGMVVLTVEDAGCGIAAEDLPHVFEPFYRSRQVRLRGLGGLGLGLAVAQRIAAAFGGNINVQSSTGQGTRFMLQLPEASLGIRPEGPHIPAGSSCWRERAAGVPDASSKRR